MSVIDPINNHVGKRVKKRRRELGLNQHQLSEKLQICYQQLWKNEEGINQIGSSRLYRIAAILGVSISYFFDGIPTNRNHNKVKKELAPTIDEINEFLVIIARINDPIKLRKLALILDALK